VTGSIGNHEGRAPTGARPSAFPYPRTRPSSSYQIRKKSSVHTEDTEDTEEQNSVTSVSSV
jgi:hypothetical protein